ncbi:MAG: cytochrome c biogenesis protein CcsA [Planctomycetaceae bacterium]
MLQHVTWVCFFASFSVALLLELTQLLWPSRASRWGAIGFLSGGFLAQTAYLVYRSKDSQLPPLLGSTHDWLLVLAWLAVLMLLAVMLSDRNSGVGMFVLPAIVVLVISARYVSETRPPGVTDIPHWAMVHAATLVLGVAGIVVAFLLSLMYLVQHRRLKQKQTESVGLRLFSLERLGRWNWWAIVLSVPLLTVGMGVGVFLSVRSQSTESPVNLGQFSFALAGLLWLGVMVLFGRLVTAKRHASGRGLAWRTLWACGFLLASLLLLELFNQGGIHGERPDPTPRVSKPVS